MAITTYHVIRAAPIRSSPQPIQQATDESSGEGIPSSMYNIGKRKIASGRYRVTAGERDTTLVIIKGDPPKFGMRQGWDICDDKGGVLDAVAYDLPGLDAAIAAIRAIKQA